jgi:transposase
MKNISYNLKEIINAINNETDKFSRKKLQALLLIKQNNTPIFVADKFSVSLATIYNWINQIMSTGLTNLQIKKGRGLKPLINKKELAELKLHLLKPIKTSDGYNRGWQSKDVFQYIFKKYGIKYSLRRVQEILNIIGFRKIVCRPKSKRRNEELTQKFLANVKKKEFYWVKNTN